MRLNLESVLQKHLIEFVFDLMVTTRNMTSNGALSFILSKVYDPWKLYALDNYLHLVL